MIDLRDQHDVAAEKRDATDDGGFGISGVATPMQDESRAPCRPERGEEENEFHQLGDLRPVGGDEAHGGKTDPPHATKESGRAPCRERVCPYAYNSVGA